MIIKHDDSKLDKSQDVSYVSVRIIGTGVFVSHYSQLFDIQ